MIKYTNVILPKITKSLLSAIIFSIMTLNFCKKTFFNPIFSKKKSKAFNIHFIYYGIFFQYIN